MISLPEEYLANMKELLKEDFEAYLDSFDHSRSYGLRVNTSKISVEDFLKISPFRLTPIPWTADGFYYSEDERPAKHPYYYAGLYYIQEPSAMLPAEVLEVEENDLVLDACAAPGGKSLKLANKLHGTGVLVANDISVSRAQILLKTLENGGIANSYVMAEDIASLSGMDGCFDRILIDAPCSGEGMFRKEPDLMKSWLERGNEYYASLQKKIIEAGLRLLKDGGKLVYSTCTFSPKEDEEIIEYALSICPKLKVLPIPQFEGFMPGISEHTSDCVRLYPHKIHGEGHFIAYLQKGNSTVSHSEVPLSKALQKYDFFKDVSLSHHSLLTDRKGKDYLCPALPFETKNLRILRSGLYLGELNRNRKYEPSQALAYALKEKEYARTISLSADDPRILRYLKCETISVGDFAVEGTVLVCVDHYPLGFGIVKDGFLKNKYSVHYRYQ